MEQRAAELCQDGGRRPVSDIKKSPPTNKP